MMNVGDLVRCTLGESSVVAHVRQVYPYSRSYLVTVVGDTRDIEIGPMWAVVGAPAVDPSITCPECGRTSYHPEDIKQGYCGVCHWWTSDPQLGKVRP